MTNRWITLCLFVSISRFITASSNHNLFSDYKAPLEKAIDNTTAVDLERSSRTISVTSQSIPASRERNARGLNAYTKNSVRGQSLTQEIYGITNLPEGDTRSTFQEIFDEHVVSYFALRVDSKLVLDSEITVTNVLLRQNGNRNLQEQPRHLDVAFETPESNFKGSSVIITFDQQLSYFGENLPLETLVTVPFITDVGRDEFITKLKDSGDIVLRNIIGVSGVDLPPQSSIPAPISLPTQQPPGGEPGGSEPQPSQPTNSPPGTPPRSPTLAPSKRPTPDTIQTASPSEAPPTTRPTPVVTKSNPLQQNNNSGGISGLLVIACLMVLLFIVFMINMKYCMGEYVD